MELKNFVNAGNAILQIVWGDQKIEFRTSIVELSGRGVLAMPYILQGKPLELSINMQTDNVVCNLFADDPDTGGRAAFRNIELETITRKGEIFYQLQPAVFKTMATIEDRRRHLRLKVLKPGTVTDSENHDARIRVHDVSDNGISFYAPIGYEPAGNKLHVSFVDHVQDRTFDVEVDCYIVYSVVRSGNMYFGCSVDSSNNRNYLIYGCLKQAERRKRKEFDQGETE